MSDTPITQAQGLMYGKDYQFTLLAHLALDESFFKNSYKTLQLNDFGLPACQLILDALKTYFEQFKTLPNLDILALHMGQLMQSGRTVVRLAPEEFDSLAYVMQVIHSYVGRLSTEYFRAQLPDYLKSVRLSQTMDAYQHNISLGQSTESFINKIAQLDKEITLNDEIIIDNAYTNPETMTEVKQFNRVSTGLQALNTRLGGGLGAGELGMITACPGVGKTTSLLNFDEGAVVSGRRTLFISLEMAIGRIKHRYQGIAAGIDAHYFKMPMTDWPYDELRRYNAVINSEYRFFGYASMVDMSKGKHTPAAIDDTISKWKDAVLRQGGDVDTCRGVYLDWLDMLDIKGLGSSRDTKDHDLLKSACYELGRIARKHGVALWTATQGTREADGRETLSMKHVSGAYHKNDALDVGIGVGVVKDPSMAPRPEASNDPNDDDSLDDAAQAIPCNRRLMMNIMKNRDNSPCGLEVYQGPTLKLWRRQSESIAAAKLLREGKFEEYATKIRKHGGDRA